MGIKVPVVFVGSDKGNQQHVRTTAQRMGLAPDVWFLGFVPRDELIALYRNALGLVYPSFLGPENLPPLEAFALGCPVVAADVSGARDQLGDAALLVDPRRGESIALAVRALHDDPALRADLVRRGRARARQFTGDDFVRGILSLLDEFQNISRCWNIAG
jgi:glycosyltransferase involved in cell wall biosynthesis